MPDPQQALDQHLGRRGASIVAFAEANRDLTPAVDAACRYFAEHLTWPAMNKDVAWAVLPRLIGAEQFARFIARPSLPSSFEFPNFEEMRLRASLLEWLLVDYWHRAGVWRWYASLSAAASEENHEGKDN